MKELKLSNLQFSQKDVENFVNSSLDVKEGSVLFINNDEKDKLDKYVGESLKKKAKLVITSSKCSFNNKKVIKAKNYDEVLIESYSYLCNDYKSKKYFGITGTNGKRLWELSFIRGYKVFFRKESKKSLGSHLYFGS